MNRLVISIERNINILLHFLKNGPRYPPLAFNLAVADNYPSVSQTKDPVYTRFGELFGFDWGILWGCPTHKTPRAVKFKKRYSIYKLWRQKKNLVTCQNCGAWHELHKICGECYKVVKEETDAIRELYVQTGVRPTQEAVLLYKNEQVPEGEFWRGKRIVEMQRERPDWFDPDLKKRWHKIIPPDRISLVQSLQSGKTDDPLKDADHGKTAWSRLFSKRK